VIDWWHPAAYKMVLRIAESQYPRRLRMSIFFERKDDLVISTAALNSNHNSPAQLWKCLSMFFAEAKTTWTRPQQR
jgi:hypothetical protein